MDTYFDNYKGIEKYQYSECRMVEVHLGKGTF